MPTTLNETGLFKTGSVILITDAKGYFLAKPAPIKTGICLDLKRWSKSIFFPCANLKFLNRYAFSFK